MIWVWVKPPVSAGFSDEVGLIEDVDNAAGLDATVTGAGWWWKSESQIKSFLLANANQSRQLRSKK